MPGRRRPGARSGRPGERAGRPENRPDQPGVAKLKFPAAEACAACGRPKSACFCGQIVPVKNRLAVVILEHPQETHKWMNSASLAGQLFADCTVRVGLSWRNLEAATGRPWRPSEWAVLVLRGEGGGGDRPVTVRTREHQIVDRPGEIRGIIALDGNWQQAKTLWWRNPWLLKCHTVELNPELSSQRAQVKKAGLSTLEAVGFCLAHLENSPQILDTTSELYRRWIVEPARAAHKTAMSTQKETDAKKPGDPDGPVPPV